MNTLKNLADDTKRKIEVELRSFFAGKKTELSLIDPVMAELMETIESQVLRSGKRVRPLLVRVGYEMGGGGNEALVLRLGMAVELLHQFFMIHDDVVDRDEKRYGGMALHITWQKNIADRFGTDAVHLGESMGIIAGDLVQSLATEVVSNLDVSQALRHKLLTRLLTTIYETSAGWQVHYFLNQESIARATEDRFLKGMELVSARYTFAAPLLFGLDLAENEDAQIRGVVDSYAYHAGMAFQMRDDILGMFGDSAKTGKPVGNDYREGKKTLLVLRAYKNATIEHKRFLEVTLGKDVAQDDVLKAQRIIVDSGALQEAEAIAADHAKQAQKALADLPKECHHARDVLTQLANFVIAREV